MLILLFLQVRKIFSFQVVFAPQDASKDGVL